MSKPSILCVDDEPSVLDGLRRNLRREFEVTTAVGGTEGLAAIEKGQYSVVISDYQMPEMNGAKFLGHVRDKNPDSTRILLTGNADLDAAIDAVNNGNIYRFLSKPCPKEVLVPALQSAVEYHRLVVAERVLLQETLHGTIRLLTDALSIVSPAEFGRCGDVSARAGRVAADLGIKDSWKVEMAAMLAQFSLVTLPPETHQKLQTGDELLDEEKDMVMRIPQVAERLLAPLPRIEDVIDLVANQAPPWGVADEPPVDQPLGSAVIRAAIDADIICSPEISFNSALQQMEARKGFYPQKVIDSLAKHAPAGVEKAREVKVGELVPGMVLIDPIATMDGRLLVSAGNQLTLTTIEAVRNFCTHSEIQEPIRIY